VTSEPPDIAPDAREKEIERVAEELGRLIRGAGPERREDLKELAFTLIREELFQHDEREVKEGEPKPPAPFNPLGTGVLIFVLGGGLSFIFGPVGLFLMLGGVTFIIWGAVLTWLKGK
jgi:hypothetical protein